MKRLPILLMSVLAVALVAASARAAEHPLKAVPKDATAVVRIKQPDATAEKIVAFAKKIDPALEGQAKALAEQVGTLVSNPTKAGISPRGDWYAVVFARSENEPGIAYAVPVTDFAALKEAVGESFEFLQYEDWALYSQDEDTMKALREHASGSGKSFEANIDAESKKIIDAADASMFVNMVAVNRVFKNQLAQAREELARMLESLPDTPPGGQMNIEAFVDMYRTLGEGVLQGIEDSESFVISATVKPESLFFDEYLRVEEGSKSAKFFASHPTSDFKILEKLPADQIAYFAAHGDAASLMEFGMKFSAGLFGDDPETQQLMKEVSAELKKIKFGSMAGTFGLGDLESGAIRSTTLMQADPSEKMREISRKMSEQSAKVNVPGLTQTIEYQKDAETYGDVKVDILRMKQEFGPELDPLGVQNQMMQAMFGPEGMTERIAYIKGYVVQSAGGGRSAMASLLKSVMGTEAVTNSALETTRKELAEKSNFALYFDLPGFAAKAVKLVISSGQVPIPMTTDTIDDLGIKRSYFGLSIGCEPRAVRVKSSVPVEQVRGTYKLVQLFMEMFRAPAL